MKLSPELTVYLTIGERQTVNLIGDDGVIVVIPTKDFTKIDTHLDREWFEHDFVPETWVTFFPRVLWERFKESDNQIRAYIGPRGNLIPPSTIDDYWSTHE